MLPQNTGEFKNLELNERITEYSGETMGCLWVARLTLTSSQRSSVWLLDERYLIAWSEWEREGVVRPAVVSEAADEASFEEKRRMDPRTMPTAAPWIVKASLRRVLFSRGVLALLLGR